MPVAVLALAVVLGLFCHPGAAVAAVSDYSLSEESRQRVKHYLPRSYPKLIARQPVHVVALGDSITNLITMDQHSEDWVRSYPAIFLDKLAVEFVYTGGVRLIRTRSRDHADKLLPVAGPEITYTNLAINGSNVLRGCLRAASRAFLNNPDLVLVNFGAFDSTGEVPIDRYRETMDRLLKLIRDNGADCIVLGPIDNLRNVHQDESLGVLGIQRPYASVAQEIAGKNGALYIDLGDLSLVIDPIEHQFDTPDHLLPSITKQFTESLFRFENAECDLLHINLNTHKRLGRVILEQLLEQPHSPALSLAGANIYLQADGSAKGEITIENMQDEDLTCHVLPLRFAHSHRPSSVATACAVPAKGKVALSFAYAADTERAAAFPASADVVRLPFLVASPEETTIQTETARMMPIGVSWDTGLLANLQSDIELKPVIVNSTDIPFESSYTATWRDQEVSGTLSLDAGERSELALHFALPELADAMRAGGLLTLTFQNGPSFTRKLEISRNLGLGHWYFLEKRSGYALSNNQQTSSDPSEPRVQFRVDADAERIFFSYQIADLVLADVPGSPAAVVQIQIDGRAYGKRQQPGGVGELRIEFPSSADGSGKVARFSDGIFGQQYTAELDPGGIITELSTRSNGARRITIGIPRNYFYQHEYGRLPDKALGNGNSQFGLNTSLILPTNHPDTGNVSPEERCFLLLDPLASRFDAETLTTLELANPVTGRWSARLF